MKKIFPKYVIISLCALSIKTYCIDYVPLPSYVTSTCTKPLVQKNDTQKTINNTHYTTAAKATIAENKKKHWFILPLLKTVGITCAITIIATYITAGVLIIKSKQKNKLMILANLPIQYPVSIIQLITSMLNKKMPRDSQKLVNAKRIFAMHTYVLLPAIACWYTHHTITHTGIR